MAKAAKPKIVHEKAHSSPHNGEGRPDLQFPDPVNGEMIGGQVADIRMSMRYRHVVSPWARRQGKSRKYQFLFKNEAMVTTGKYYGGLVYPDHSVAYKVAEGFRESYGDLVVDYKINDKDQDRWIKLAGQSIPKDQPPPTWFTPRLIDRWNKAKKDPNREATIYFWGGQMPHATKIQGFVFPFHRIGFDEAQEIEPVVYQIVRPMLRDVKGSENFSGTPWSKSKGNVQFERFWNLAGDKSIPGWFRMRVPDGTNPHVPPTPMAEARLSMTEDEINQTMFAHFLSDAGAVFGNLDRVFILQPLNPAVAALKWLKDLRARFNMPSMAWWVSEPEAISGHVYGASIDWARSPKGDWSCMTVFDLSTGRQVLVARWRGEDFTAQMEVVLAIQQHYKAAQLHSDANGMGETMSDFLRRRHAIGFVGHKFGRNKSDYVRRGQVLFQDAAVSLIDTIEQRMEFKDFSAFEAEGLGSEKQIKYCAPEGAHDDFVATFLQLAPTLTISGRQTAQAEEEPSVPVFDEDAKTTTLERFLEGQPTPWTVQDEEPDDGKFSLDSVVIPKHL